MKILFLTLIIILTAFALPAQTNKSVSAAETWESISNRWAKMSFEKAVMAATNGDSSAEYFVGFLYWEGIGLKEDKAKALQCYQSAANHGLPAAQQRMGIVYQYGLQVEKDFAKAMSWYQLAAAQNYLNAQFHLARMYESGELVKQDYAEAARYYQMAADRGHGKSQNNLGVYYLKGYGVRPDVDEAIKYFRQSAEQGNASGQSSLGWMYEQGKGVERNHDLALKWTRAAAEQGLPEAQLQLGDFLEYQFDANRRWIPDHDGAIEWYSKAATNGLVEAMLKAGDFYFHKNAYEEILKYYGMAANQGNSQGAKKLGDFFLVNRPNHPLDHKESLKWYKIASDKGDAEAQYQLGCLLIEGKEIEHNQAEAESWLKKSADNGYNEAALKIASLHQQPSTSVLTNLSRTDLEISAFDGNGKTRLPLGVAYEDGIGGEKDFKQAVNAYCWILNLGPREDQQEAFSRMINLYATEQIKPEKTPRPANLQGLGALAYYHEMAPKDEQQMVEFLNRYKRSFEHLVGHMPASMLKNLTVVSPKTMSQIGDMFAKGISVPMDKVAAADWYKFAAKAGYAEAEDRLKLLNSTK